MSFFSKGLRTVYKNPCFVNQNTLQLPNTCTNLVMVRNFAGKSKSGKVVQGMFKIGIAGVTVGAIMGTGYSIHKMNQPRAHIMNEQTVIPALKEIPNLKPSRSIKILGDNSGLELILFQYQTCPFCCKVRAFLDYYGISYNLIEVDPVLRQSIKWSQYKKVPILVAKTEDGYQPLNDSTMIISALMSYLMDNTKSISDIVKCFPFIKFVDDSGSEKNDIMNKYFLMLDDQSVQKYNEKASNEERRWRKWADEVLVHVLSPNVYRTTEEAVETFKWFSEVGEWEANFPTWERNLMIYGGASAMWLISKRLKKRHNLKEDVRQSLYDECNSWLRAIHAKGTKYMGGDQPNLSDLAVYGVLNSIEGCRAFKDLLDRTKIGKWYFSMKELVSQHRGSLSSLH